MSIKKTITVVYEGKSYGVSWYSGSDDAAIEKAIRLALDLDADLPLHLVDEEKNSIAICDALSSGITLTYAPKVESKLPKNETKEAFTDDRIDVLKKFIATHGNMALLPVSNGTLYISNDAENLHEILSRTDDFQKVIPPPIMGLGNLRAFTTGDGLFTSSDSEEIWQMAHRVLLPGFGVQAIRGYYERMVQVADELIVHFKKQPEKEPLLVTDWMTRMTFEAIGYAGFSERFHCMDQKELPPFVHAMVISLTDAMHASTRKQAESSNPEEREKRKAADALMQKSCDEMIRIRKEKIAKGEKELPNDLLQIMLTNKDHKTGKFLPEENIRNQLITFLIAGHETTSGLLSYAIYYLTKNPDIEKKLIEEVDRVLGRDFSYSPTYDDLEKLDYTLRILKETLRLQPTAPGFTKTALKETTLSGKYPLKKGDQIFFLLSSLHRNPKYWAADTERFDPDRFLPSEVEKRNPDAYHPFGAGIRSCIGFQFALKEATMVLARLYQQFHFQFADKNYQLAHVETLTVKPKDLYVMLEKRTEEKGKLPQASSPSIEKKEPLAPAQIQEDAPVLLILFGSNMGTCQGIAQELALHAQAKGYRPIVRELDSQVEKPWESPYVVIITSTYNGTPPDNATAFEKWIKNLQGTPFSSLYYTVLGVGNKQWAATFQQFPRYVDKRLEELGAHRFFPVGAADVDSDYDGAIESWAKGAWQKSREMRPEAKIKAEDENIATLAYSCEVANFSGAHSDKPPYTQLERDVKEFVVSCNKELLSQDAKRSTRHIELALPEHLSYSAGDHLGVLPQNPQEAVEKVAKLCNLRLTDMVIIKSLQEAQGAEKLPIGIPISVRDLLTSYIDLLGPVSRKELRLFAQKCPCPPEKMALLELADAKFAEEILAKEYTFMEVCDRFGSLTCTLELLLSARPLLKARYYSISSSPLMLQNKCSITVGVQEHLTKTNRLLKGVCSNYLATVQQNGALQCVIKDTKSHFRLPDDPKQDVILIGPGTGLAPLRGFLQERQKQKEQGIQIGRTILFFGCRNPDQDYIYKTELEEYKKTGLLQELFVAFSRVPGQPKCYVQDLLQKNSALVWEYVKNNARILLCGDGKSMAPCVRETLTTIYEKEGKMSQDEAQKFFKEKQSSYQYVEDVWAG